MKNMTMVCSYRSSRIDLPVAIFDFQTEGCPFLMYQDCQRKYVILNSIYFERAERKICHNCVDNIWDQGKSERLKKVGYSTV